MVIKLHIKLFKAFIKIEKMARRKITRREIAATKKKLKKIIDDPRYYRTRGRKGPPDVPYNISKMADNVGKSVHLVLQAIHEILYERKMEKTIGEMIKDKDYQYPPNSIYYNKKFPYRLTKIATEVALSIPTVRDIILKKIQSKTDEIDMLDERIATFNACKEKEKKIKHLRIKLGLREQEIQTILELSQSPRYWHRKKEGNYNYLGIAMQVSKGRSKTITLEQVKTVLDEKTTIENLLI